MKENLQFLQAFLKNPAKVGAIAPSSPELAQTMISGLKPDDGNIILITQQTGFRIFRGLLAAQSTVFADMFATASSQPDETLDGCPVVHLSDSHLDLAHLLRILLPASPLWCVSFALDLNGFYLDRLQLSYCQI